jgi:regulator of RNase E activity RraA
MTDAIDFADLARRLYTPVLSDTLDSMGLTAQAMRPFVRPLDEGLTLFGPARTGLYMSTYSVAEGENPYEIEIALIDDLKPGEVAVLGCGGPTDRIAPWGELLSTAARCRGAAGCVTDGLVRDVRAIRDMHFPVFHGGIGPLDSRGRGKMMAMDVPIACGGVVIHPGDLIFADVDGVIAIPAARAAEAIARALEKVGAENHTRDALLQGLKLGEVYRRFGVL